MRRHYAPLGMSFIAGDRLAVFDDSKCEHLAERKGRTVYIYDHDCLDEITEALSVGDEDPQC